MRMYEVYVNVNVIAVKSLCESVSSTCMYLFVYKNVVTVKSEE